MIRVMADGLDAAALRGAAEALATGGGFELVGADLVDAADVALVADDREASALDRCRALAGRVPCVLATTGAGEPAVLTEAMEAGARGVVRVPFDAFELERALGAAAAAHAAPREARGRRRGRVVVVSAGAGGAGTSTVAWALATLAPGPVALLDVDLAGGALAALAGIDDEPTSAGLAGETSGRQAFERLAVDCAVGRVLAAPARPELAWLVREGVVRDLVRTAAEWGATTVVDAGRAVGPALEALAEADVAVAVVRPGPRAALQAARHVETLADIVPEPGRVVVCHNAAPPFAQLVAAGTTRHADLVIPYDRALRRGVVGGRVRRAARAFARTHLQAAS
jgi:pilus assembly protein CpaE